MYGLYIVLQILSWVSFFPIVVGLARSAQCQATQAIFQEALRVLRPGGYIAIVDNNPKSAVIQNLPAVLFTLMKSTEPWSDDYYTLDVEATMQAVGFEHVVTVPSDPRHRTIVGRKP